MRCFALLPIRLLVLSLALTLFACMDIPEEEFVVDPLQSTSELEPLDESASDEQPEPNVSTKSAARVRMAAAASPTQEFHYVRSFYNIVTQGTQNEVTHKLGLEAPRTLGASLQNHCVRMNYAR